MSDKIVYLKGCAAAPPQEDDAAGQSALRQVFLDALKDLRARRCRAAVIITLEDGDNTMWRIGGDFSTGEVVAALEFTKLRMVLEE
jgi:hypothetical protein